ncbi:MAG TPA: HesA/MoeB/ThiF family protein [Dehalococcoidales bacterium]
MLTPEEKQRYDRQIIIPDFGEAGQEKLKQARVVIAGSGGLGSPAAIYLAAAGLGTIRIIDHDKVELSNLNRQVLHWDRDIGRSKVQSAAEKLTQLNKNVRLETIEATITGKNAVGMVAGFDVIIDALDNLPTRFLLNKAAIEYGIPFVHGAVYGLEGRAITIIPGKSACLRCLYQGVPPQEKFPVLGTTPAVIGCIQATEAIKLITGIGTPLANRLLIYDGLNMKFTELTVNRKKNCEHCGTKARKQS